MSDSQLIAKYLAKHKVTVCPQLPETLTCNVHPITKRPCGIVI